VDPAEFTLGDALDIEEAGFDLSELGRLVAGGRVPIKFAVLLIWIMRRREDPSFTYDDARALRVTELEVEMVEVPESPKDGSGGGVSPPSVSQLDGPRRRSAG
jgi:hypothetical protein